MKKLIQFCSILSLVVVFTAISAQAQISRQYKAEIPFDFSVDQKSYQAGSYVIRVAKLSLDVVSVSLSNKKNNVLQTLLTRKTNQSNKVETKLVFTREGDERYLSLVSLEDMGIKINNSNEAKSGFKVRQAAKNSKSKGKPESEVLTEVVAIKE